MTGKKPARPNLQESMPSGEEVQKELNTAKSMDDFFGKEGIFARVLKEGVVKPGDVIEVVDVPGGHSNGQ